MLVPCDSNDFCAFPMKRFIKSYTNDTSDLKDPFVPRRYQLASNETRWYMYLRRINSQIEETWVFPGLRVRVGFDDFCGERIKVTDTNPARCHEPKFKISVVVPNGIGVICLLDQVKILMALLHVIIWPFLMSPENDTNFFLHGQEGLIHIRQPMIFNPSAA